MADTTVAKRSAESEQSVDTYAVCTYCSTLSQNLETCDKCGGKLSNDTVVCYSAEPKRARTQSDSTTTATSTASSPEKSTQNGTAGLGTGLIPLARLNQSSSASTTPLPTSPVASSPQTANPQPVPQALYLNNSTGPGSQLLSVVGQPNASGPVPQALFVVSGTQSIATNSISQASQLVSVPTTPVATPAGVNIATPPQQLVYLNNTASLAQSTQAVPTTITTTLVSAAAAPSTGVVQNHTDNRIAMPPPPPYPNPALRPAVANNLIPQAVYPGLQNTNNQVNQVRAPVNSVGIMQTANPLQSLNIMSRNSAPLVLGQTVHSAIMQNAPLGTATGTRMPQTQVSVASNRPVPALRAAPVTRTDQVTQVSLPCSQIRIGTRKFQLANPAVVKDSGILLTVKGHVNSPVLLNSRAMVVCRAHLKSVFPVMFVYIETSCVQQIREIFKIQKYEFYESSKASDKKRITLLPNSLPENKAAGIKQIFEKMQSQIKRDRALLEEIDHDTALDLLSPPSNNNPEEGPVTASPERQTGNDMSRQASMANNTGGMPMPHAQGSMFTLANGPMSGMRSMSPATRGMAPMPPVPMGNPIQAPAAPPQPAFGMNNNNISRNAQRMPGDHINTMNSMPPNTNALQVSGVRPPPLIHMPVDPSGYAELQKKLVKGEVYQVQLPSGDKKYAVWNGMQLVDCLVRNTEVHLGSQLVRIGTLKAVPVGKIRVGNDRIAFDMKDTSDRVYNVSIQQSELVVCYICFEKIPSILIYPKREAVLRLQNIFGLHGNKTDLYYSPNARAERHRHFIIFLTGINSDQKEALSQMMKATMTNPIPMLRETSSVTILKILTDIRQTSQGDGASPNLPGIGPGSGNRTPQADVGGKGDDSDDDDVIMTSEEIGIKCPYTQQVMKDPVKNKHCGHNYERSGIVQFINNKKGNAKCPYAGCGNDKPLAMADMIDNVELREYIRTKVQET